MSVTPSHKMLCAASAASLSAMGFLMAFMAPAPVGASPMRPLDPAVPCASYTFPANFTVKQDNGIVVVIDNPVGSTFSGVGASYSIPGQTQPTSGHASGGVTGQENIDFTINWDGGFSNHYTGVVNKNLTAQGMSTNNKGAQNVWASAPMTLNCVAAPAPVQQQQQQPQVPPQPATATAPNIVVTPVQKNGSLDFTVANNSAAGVDAQCTYEGTKVGKPFPWNGETTQNFPLKAGATHSLKFAGLPLNSTYHVSITCQGQNGGSVFSGNFSG